MGVAVHSHTLVVQKRGYFIVLNLMIHHILDSKGNPEIYAVEDKGLAEGTGSSQWRMGHPSAKI